LVGSGGDVERGEKCSRYQMARFVKGGEALGVYLYYTAIGVRKARTKGQTGRHRFNGLSLNNTRGIGKEWGGQAPS